MMEAIGQKAVLSSTDEVIISDELGVDSVSYTHLTLPTNREV